MKFQKIVRLFIFVFLIVCVEVFVGWKDILAYLKNIAEISNSPLFFILLMGIGSAFGFPVSACYIFAGIAFGIFWGWIYCLTGLFISGTFAYVVVRFFVSEEDFLKIVKFFKIKTDLSKLKYHANFFLRAIPGTPYFLQNILLAGIKTSYPMYIVMLLLTQGSVALAMNFIVGAFAVGSVRKGIAAGLLILFLACVHRIMGKYYLKKNSMEIKEMEGF